MSNRSSDKRRRTSDRTLTGGFRVSGRDQPRPPTESHASHMEQVLLKAVHLTKEELIALGTDNAQIRALEDWLTQYTRERRPLAKKEQPISGAWGTYDLMSQERATGPAQEIKVAELMRSQTEVQKIIHVQGRKHCALPRQRPIFRDLKQLSAPRGPLGEGEVRNYEVTCPWHGWKYTFWMAASA